MAATDAQAVDLKDRFRGSLLGLAVGDAVGLTSDGKQRGSFNPVTDMVGGGRFRLLPGQWADGTSMALVLAESLVERGTFDPMDQGHRYWQWYSGGRLTSTGQSFNIGMSVRGAIAKFNPVPDDRRRLADEPIRPFPGSIADWAAGNDCVVRISPVALFLHRHPAVAMDRSVDSVKVTHGSDIAMDTCRYFAGLLVGCLLGVTKEELLSQRYSPVPNHYQDKPLVQEVDALACGSFKTEDEAQIKAISYSVSSLQAALWAFYHTDNFRDGCLRVANLGQDSDTAAAIYGQLAGAYYGIGGIPEDWRKKCFLSTLILLFADELYRLSLSIQDPPPLEVPESTYLRGVERFSEEAVSEEYRNKKMIGYALLEEGGREVVKRTYQGPTQFQNIEEYVVATDEVKERYERLPVETQCPEMLAHFEARWEKGRHDFLNKPSRFFY